MQEGGQALHHAENGNGQDEPEGEANKHDDNAGDARVAERLADGHAPQHFAELGVRQ